MNKRVARIVKTVVSLHIFFFFTGKCIQLKHRAPVIDVTVLNGDEVPQTSPSVHAAHVGGGGTSENMKSAQSGGVEVGANNNSTAVNNGGGDHGKAATNKSPVNSANHVLVIR